MRKCNNTGEMIMPIMEMRVTNGATKDENDDVNDADDTGDE